MKTVSLTNTIAASAGDISLTARKLNIVTTNGTFPTLEYGKIKSFTLFPSLVETVSTWKFSYTAPAADNTEYGCAIKQNVNGRPVIFSAHLRDSGVGATNQSIADALVAQINGSGLNVTASWTSNNAFIDVVGKTGNPLFIGLSGKNVTAAKNMTALTLVSTSDASPNVFTKASHGLSVGQTVDVTGVTTNLAANGTWRVRAIPTANTFHVEDANGNVLNTAGQGAGANGTVTLKDQQARGQGVDLATAGIAGATTGKSYTQYDFVYDFDAPGSAGGDSRTSGNTHDLYVDDTTTTAVPTNFVNFTLDLKQKMSADVSAVVPVGTVAVADVI